MNGAESLVHTLADAGIVIVTDGTPRDGTGADRLVRA